MRQKLKSFDSLKLDQFKTWIFWKAESRQKSNFEFEVPNFIQISNLTLFKKDRLYLEHCTSIRSCTTTTSTLHPRSSRTPCLVTNWGGRAMGWAGRQFCHLPQLSRDWPFCQNWPACGHRSTKGEKGAPYIDDVERNSGLLGHALLMELVLAGCELAQRLRSSCAPRFFLSPRTMLLSSLSIAAKRICPATILIDSKFSTKLTSTVLP